jgi:hypothetical protein
VDTNDGVLVIDVTGDSWATNSSGASTDGMHHMRLPTTA